MDKEQEQQNDLFARMEAYNIAHDFKEPPYTSESDSLSRYTSSSFAAGFSH